MRKKERKDLILFLAISFLLGPKTAPAKTGGGRSPPLPRGGAGTDGPSAPQMGGLFAGGMPKLKSSNNGKS